jgi:hypothetical protein
MALVEDIWPNISENFTILINSETLFYHEREHEQCPGVHIGLPHIYFGPNILPIYFDKMEMGLGKMKYSSL